MARHPRQFQIPFPSRSRTPRSPQQTSGIDDVYKSVSAAKDPEAVQEGKKILESLARLKYEVQHDRPLTYVKVPHVTSFR